MSVKCYDLGPTGERAELEAIHGQVWTTDELQDEFHVIAFSAPFAEVERKKDGKRGAMEFQHHPRFYWGFMKDKDDEKDDE